MATTHGTLTTLDTLATLNNATVADIGETDVWRGIDLAFQAHNALTTNLLDELAEFGTQEMDSYGGASSMVMEDLDQFGSPDAQKVSAGYNIGYPMRKYGAAVQWTRDYFLNVTGEEFAKQIQGILDADLQLVYRELRRALYRPTNYTFTDRLVRNLSLAVKALINADSSAIQPGPNGEAFNGASHTHYLATASFIAANLTSLITTIAEHWTVGQINVGINSNDEATVRGFTGFVADVDPVVVQADTATYTNRGLTFNNIYNRRIGRYNGADIYVKPWVLSGYPAGWLTGGPRKVLRVRQPARGPVGLNLVYDDERSPLRARGYEHRFGVAVQERLGAAVIYTGGGSYTAPTIS